MKKFPRIALFATVLGVNLLLLRNYQMYAGLEAYKTENGLTAIEKLKPLAYLGEKTAQIIIGSIYAYGLNGIPKNDAEAIYWFRRCGSIGPFAVEAGDDPAAPHELDVAKAYMNGNYGVKVDLIESRKWLHLAAQGGSKEAATILAWQQNTLATTHTCTKNDAIAAEKLSTAQSWKELHQQFQRYAHCDDGAIGQNFSESVSILLEKHWGNLKQLEAILESNPDFLPFVLRHIDSTVPIDRLQRITGYADTQCPYNLKNLCRAIKEKSGNEKVIP